MRREIRELKILNAVLLVLILVWPALGVALAVSAERSSYAPQQSAQNRKLTLHA